MRIRAATHAGFTLLESAVALVIAAIMLAVGVPGLGAWMAEREVQDRAEALFATLDFARSEAIRRGARVEVCPGADCPGAARPWEDGWIVVPDAGDGTRPAPIARERAAPSGITIRGNRPVADYVSYTAAGRARRLDGALQMGTFTVCRPGHRARKVILANSGRVRVETSPDGCP